VAAAHPEIAAARTIVDRRRAGWRPRLPDGLGSAADDPAVLLELSENETPLPAAFRHLTSDERAFLMLAATASYVEVGQQYGITANAVKQRVKRFRRVLRGALATGR
jgi:DNA-directed RNA polymerase specialized sigma24 family protein